MQEPSILADAILEIHASELQHFFDDLVLTFNSLNDLLRDQGILRGKELAEMNVKASQAVKAARSPIEKLLVLNAYLKQQISHLGRSLQTRTPQDQGMIRTAITKIHLRAVAIVEHVRTIAEGKKEVAFNSAQTRDFLAGREGKPPSRRDTIRALRRAEKLCPALACGHTPGDGRQTIRLTAKTEDLRHSEITKDDRGRTTRQQSKMEELRMIFFKEGISGA